MNVQKALEKLHPMSTSAKFERLKAITNINIDAYDLMKKEGMANRCTEFLYFYKVVEPLLNKMKGKTAAMMRNKQQQMNSYQDFHNSMERYENFNLQNYTDMVTENLIITNPDNMELKIKLQELTGNL